MSKPKNLNIVDGTNFASWVYPYERDTTRGYPEAAFPSLHNDAPRVVLVAVSCKLCGLDFAYLPTSSPKPLYCLTHSRWAPEKRKKFAEKKK